MLLQNHSYIYIGIPLTPGEGLAESPKSGLEVFLLCDLCFLIGDWAFNPRGEVIFYEGFRIGFASTLFESSLALLKVRSVMLRTKNSDDDDKGSYDTDKDTLHLKNK